MAAPQTASLEEAAALVYKNRPARLVTIVGAGLACLIMAPWQVCVGWIAAGLSLEIWGHLIERSQSRAQTMSRASRANFIVYFAGMVLSWLFLATLLWRIGTLGSLVCAAVIGATVTTMIPLLRYQSPAALILAGTAPAAAALAVVAVKGGLPGVILLPGAVFLGLSLLIAFGRTEAMPSALAAQRQLALSEMQFRIMTHNISEVIARTGLDGGRIYMSPQIELLTGYAEAEVKARGLLSFIHDDDRDRVAAAGAQVAQDGGDASVEFRMINRTGEVTWVETSITRAAFNGPDNPLELISVSRDVSARKAMEFELIAAKDQAEAASRAKSDFLANMSHELRTPLNGVIGFSRILRDAEGMRPEHARYAALIDEGGTALLAVINNVLDFSRLEADAIQPSDLPFNPTELIKAITGLLTLQAEEKALELKVTLEGPQEVLVGDATLVRQVILNLLGNALKFTERGRVNVCATQTKRNDGLTTLQIAVSDTGIGLPPDQLERVFERFVQADGSTSRRFGGTGLGLAICQRIVHLMGGRIGAESVEGEGSTFWFELDLPSAELASLDALSAQRSRPFEIDLANERPLRVLIADDVPVNRELVCAILSPFNVSISHAADGSEALKLASREAFDVILMDVQMPVMDGLAATRAIRRLDNPRHANAPIVALSANVLPEQVTRCLEAGMTDHIGKPIDTERLLEVIARVTTTAGAYLAASTAA